MRASESGKVVLRSAMPKAGSSIEASLGLQMRAAKLPEPVAQYRPFPDRRFTLDYAWPPLAFAVEVDGMVHRIKGRFAADIEKHALLVLDGWTVLRVGGREVRSGVALQWVERMLRQRGNLAGIAEALT